MTTPHDLSLMTLEVYEGIRLLEDFFDSRGMDASVYFAHFSIGRLAKVAATSDNGETWNAIREEFKDTLDRLLSSGAGFVSDEVKQRFERRRSGLAFLV